MVRFEAHAILGAKKQGAGLLPVNRSQAKSRRSAGKVRKPAVQQPTPVKESATPLIDAVLMRDVDEFRRLLASGHDPDETDPEHHDCPLHYAAAGRRGAGFVDELILVGANVNCRNDYGRTPLMWAVASSYSETLECVELFIAAGADLNAVDNDEESVLMKAVAAGAIEAVKCLIAHGADATYRNSYGESALTTAERTGMPIITELLREALS